MIIKTSKLRKDFFEEINLYSNVVGIKRCYNTTVDGVVIDVLDFTTNYQNVENFLYVDMFDAIYVLNDEGKKIYAFVPLKEQNNENSDGSLNKTTSASKDESGEVNK